MMQDQATIKEDYTVENATTFQQLQEQESYSDLFSNLNINDNI